MNSEKLIVIIPAAGAGTRMGNTVKKQFLSLGSRPILAWTLEALSRISWVNSIYLILPENQIEYVQSEILVKYQFNKVNQLIAGGAERQDSVYAGLKRLPEGEHWIMVHDGVRPFIAEKLVRQLRAKAFHTGAAVLGVPIRETIKRVSSNRIISTEDRQHFWLIQTPQIFRKSILVDAYEKAFRENYYGTDDSSLVERTGTTVSTVEGHSYNLKITSPEDLVVAEKLLSVYFPEFQ